MSDILLVSSRSNCWTDFVSALKANGEFLIKAVRSGREALNCLEQVRFVAVIVDEEIEDVSALGLVRQVVGIDAMINIACVSGLSEAEFHEQAEGLGILMKLPLHPNAEDAFRFTECLYRVAGAI